jgi:hypothetical protein
MHSPLAQAPLHVAPDPQSTWHGGLRHEKSQDSWAAHMQVPLEQSAEES